MQLRELTLNYIVFLILANVGLSTMAQDRENKYVIEFGRLLMNLATIENQTSIDFILREFELSDQQRKEIKKNYTEWTDRQSDIRKAMLALLAKQKEDPNADRDSISRELKDLNGKWENVLDDVQQELNNILLDHQLKRLGGLMKQRSYVANVQGRETVDYLLVMDLDLSNHEKKELESKLKKEKDEFFRVKKQLRQKAWQKIVPSLPDEVLSEIKPFLKKQGIGESK